MLFPDDKEAAFGNLCFWQALAFSVVSALGIPESVCAVHVVTSMLALVVVVLAMYLALEFQVKRRQATRHKPMERNEGEGEQLKVNDAQTDVPM